jgi:MYXO-CTERM domain-containing protein
MIRRNLLAAAALGAAVFASTAVRADDFVLLTDDGTIESSPFMTVADETTAQTKLLALYAATGKPLPEYLSVWSTFPLGGSPYGTFFDPIAADVQGIGLQADYGGDGTFTSSDPPLHCILFHNDVTQLAARAAIQSAPAQNFARYLFLLEMTHNWGPALAVPAPNASELIGFDFHWSFFDDAGGSPAGGNVWTDNGDGTFTTVAADPSTMKYSMLDLYLMGLATTAEVPPFGVLENVVAPASPTDPLWGGTYAGHSFPWFDATSALTVQATRRTLAIDDVVSANGARVPAAGSGPTTHTLGIVLLVSGTEDAATVAQESSDFGPIASSFAPWFQDATHGRATLDVVTTDGAGGGGGGAGGGATTSATSATATTGSGAGGGDAAPAATLGDSSGCGIATPGDAPIGTALAAIGALALVAGRRRRRA